MAFAAVVLGNVGLILANRSRQATLGRNAASPEPRSGGLSVERCWASRSHCTWQPMREIFRFGRWMGISSLLAAAATVGLVGLELYKAVLAARKGGTCVDERSLD